MVLWPQGKLRKYSLRCSQGHSVKGLAGQGLDLGSYLWTSTCLMQSQHCLSGCFDAAVRCVYHDRSLDLGVQHEVVKPNIMLAETVRAYMTCTHANASLHRVHPA